ncbi:MAG: bifunctional N-acetyltransferase/class I SAM-dependent methyltransferase [Bacteroidales bacterium]|nr:bifunctional N-acetyltransferase/class I SAM-dependent methyltransferase [Lachnoclostridium sp.]MCM1385519.1 bifunctional N-acetyltransferase/class I SAM-dependent methyltransferase [Lachnoclostridium sp.]MCM1466310.1 bifunctional N-acetyltransferase/class I SAM-dependent methyltransferase [Bacteroidales bacterium]
MLLNWSMFTRKESISKKDILYSVKNTVDLSEEEIEECSELFSLFYGRYSAQSKTRPGEQVKMGTNYYKQHYCKPGFFVAMAREGKKLVGQAFYIRKKYEGYGIITWVLQLVVDKNYRKQGIASTLLRSIWGFSDDYAWGLATANPCTVKTLESATFRKCCPAIIKKNLRAIKLIGNDTTFVASDAYDVTNCTSQVNTGFFIDNTEFNIENSCEKYLGKLKPGYEWLAFTFQNQSIKSDKYRKHFDEVVEFSEKILKEAYSRMDIATHGWTKGTENEVSFIAQYCNGESVLDLGCGIGRHDIALSKLGYKVCGIDFSAKYIAYANREMEKENALSKCEFICEDVRFYKAENKFDNVICLYDVIGSFPDKQDNVNIIKTAYRNLNENGIFILSVMNMELTESIALPNQKADLKERPDILMKLPPSGTMQKSGNIFNPKFFAIDETTRLVYRKEQFGNDNSLSAEYVIRDKRYTMDEIEALLLENQFDILDKRYVRAGHFDERLNALDKQAKEICIVAQKREDKILKV